MNEKLNYIEIPALLKVKYPLTEIRPYIVGGPIINILASANEDISNGTQSQSNDISSLLESFDLNFLVGAGMEFNSGATSKIFFQAGYSLGLSNILKASNNTTIKNNGFQLTGGIKFSL